MVHVAHQHGVNLHFFKARVEGGVNTCHHLAEFILACDRVKLAGVEAVDADINRRQPGLAPLRDIARQAVAVGCDGNLADGGVFTHGGDDVAKIAAQRWFAAGQPHFFGAEIRERARHATNFVEREEAFVGDACGLVAIRQAIGATKVADVSH